MSAIGKRECPECHVPLETLPTSHNCLDLTCPVCSSTLRVSRRNGIIAKAVALTVAASLCLFTNAGVIWTSVLLPTIYLILRAPMIGLLNNLFPPQYVLQSPQGLIRKA
jgi:hypothetical protein